MLTTSRTPLHDRRPATTHAWEQLQSVHFERPAIASMPTEAALTLLAIAEMQDRSGDHVGGVDEIDVAAFTGADLTSARQRLYRLVERGMLEPAAAGRWRIDLRR